MAMFFSYVTNYQRVSFMGLLIIECWPSTSGHYSYAGDVYIRHENTMNKPKRNSSFRALKPQTEMSHEVSKNLGSLVTALHQDDLKKSACGVPCGSLRHFLRLPVGNRLAHGGLESINSSQKIWSFLEQWKQNPEISFHEILVG